MRIEMKSIFVPHELKTIEVDVSKKIFRINGEEFGEGCTGFRITCHRYDEFDIRVEVDTTVHLVTIRGGKCVKSVSYETSDPQFIKPEATPSEDSDEQD